MILTELDRLAALLEDERDAVLAEWRARVRVLPSARNLDVPSLNDHIPLLISELVEALRSRSGDTVREVLKDGSPPAHGMQRVQDGFDIEEVVSEYNAMRACIHDLAEERGIQMQGKPFRITHSVLDAAIGLAVKTFAERRAEEVQRRRDEYLAFVAHDIRTPLNAISLAVQVLDDARPERAVDVTTAHVSRSLRRNLKQVEVLVNKVLEESVNVEADAGLRLVRRTFDLWPLVETLVLDLRTVAASGRTEIVNEVPPDLEASADASLLRRVFQNLASNAIHYAPNGKVVVGAREVPDWGVECWVSDDGEGIASDALGKIFDKGESDPETDGRGLGLAIVKTFVEAHGGTVTVESAEGAGATFRFLLPRIG